jgi:DHA2 family multidrug resistance protein
MTMSSWLAVTFSLRRFTLFVIGLSFAFTVLIPLTADIDLLYVLRTIQGLAGGFTIPLLMATALRATPPSIRLYGLAVYALTSTVTPGLAGSLAALWTEAAGWRFVFFEAIPLAAVAIVLAWYGLPQDPPRHEWLRMFDWRGALLVVAGFGSLTTLLQQGDRLDWFNSPLICTLAIVSVAAIPLLLLNEWFHELPLLKLQLLGRRNFAYAPIGLFVVLIISLSAGQFPLAFLTQVQGYRPIQAYPIVLEIAGLQVVMLPLMAIVLNVKWVDARVISFIGLACILAACLGDTQVTTQWNRNQFYLWQALQGIGQPMFVVSLLMIGTNDVRPEEGPFASVLVNTPRALAEATGIWLLGLITRWRGGLHTDRLLDQPARNAFR